MASASVKKRPDGRWRARYRDQDGREHAKHFDRKLDGEAWLVDQQAAMRRGDWIDPRAGRVTFGDFATGWLERQTFDDSTREAVASRLRVHLVPTFGGQQLRAFCGLIADRTRPPTAFPQVRGLVVSPLARCRRSAAAGLRPAAMRPAPRLTCEFVGECWRPVVTAGGRFADWLRTGCGPRGPPAMAAGDASTPPTRWRPRRVTARAPGREPREELDMSKVLRRRDIYRCPSWCELDHTDDLARDVQLSGIEAASHVGGIGELTLEPLRDEGNRVLREDAERPLTVGMTCWRGPAADDPTFVLFDTYGVDDLIHLTPREARSLAVLLLQAADAVEAAS